ncbi:MAG: murein transglycosylase A [Sphingomonas sp.]|nr:murein transglycosylase A [Sphingomonas sp.]
MTKARWAFCLALLLPLASCVTPVRPSAPPLPEAPAPEPANAIEAGIRAARAPDLSPSAAQAALAAFRISCPALVRRQDASGLAAPEDWRAACDAAATAADAPAFFRTYFEAVEVGDAAAFATGYFEPEIPGSRVRAPGYQVPVYAVPPDLLDANPATGERGRGRVDETGAYVLYHDRAAIEDGALARRGLEIGWATDPADLFFLQIQGSGRLKLPDGEVMRIGYAGQNGREYVAIGRLLRDRGILQTPVSMQAIRAWMAANPEGARALMRENPSYVFFRELTGPGPLGALELPVTPRVSIAADPRFVPLGAPVILSGMSDPRADGLWIAQDTGGAIRGANRVDTFWGAGEEAALIAGGMQARGRAIVLLPRGALERIRARAAADH